MLRIWKFIPCLWVFYSHKFQKFHNTKVILTRGRLWIFLVQFSSVQPLSHVRLWDPMDCSTPGLSVHYQLLELTQTHVIELMMPSNRLILCHPLLLLPSIFTSIRVFSNESVLCIRWPKYWSFSFSISPSNEHPDWSPLGWTGWISLLSKRLSRVFSNATVQKHQFLGAQFSLWSKSHGHTWLLEKP